MSLLASQLADLIGPENVRNDAVSLEAYSHDATPLFDGLPEVIVTPRSTEEVAQVVRFAANSGSPIIAREAGSNLCAATVALNGGIVLSMMHEQDFRDLTVRNDRCGSAWCYQPPPRY